MEDFGVVLYNEVASKSEIQLNFYAVSNYCIDEFNGFLITKKVTSNYKMWAWINVYYIFLIID